MTVQFNLLPDIKVEYLKAKRQQHLVVVVSVFASAAALAVFVLLLTVVYGLQKKNLSDLNTDIKSASSQLQSTKDLTKILTVQNQLKALPGLHNKKVVASRLFDYLSRVTPASVSITKLDIDYSLNALTVSGSAPDLMAVNTYADSLKFTTYKTKTQTKGISAFSRVVLAQFSRTQKDATYSLQFGFDPLIFSETQEVTLTVPQIISTRSEVDKPTALFQSGGGQ
ncbi:MAG TPA: hypothetical protein VIR03_01700 [Candidatus Saccharimonadales bacterium]